MYLWSISQLSNTQGSHIACCRKSWRWSGTCGCPGVCPSWAGGGLHSSLGPSPCISQPRGHSRASKLPKARSSEGTRWLLQCVSRQARVGNGGTCQCQCSGQAHPTRVWGTKCCWAPFVLLFAMVRISCLGGAKRHPQLIPHAVLVNLPSKLETRTSARHTSGVSVSMLLGQD